MAKAMKIGEVVPVGVFDVHANGVKVVGYLEAWVERSLAISAVDGLISVGRARFKVGDQEHGQEVAHADMGTAIRGAHAGLHKKCATWGCRVGPIRGDSRKVGVVGGKGMGVVRA